MTNDQIADPMKPTDPGFLRIGLCGWQSAQAVYFQTFDTLEIDSSFYKLPQLKTVERWRKLAPDGFIFTMKAWQIITHEPYSPTYRKHGIEIPPAQWKSYGSFRPTPPVFEAWLKTRDIAEALNAPVVVFQCPAQFTPTPEHIANLRNFFTTIQRGRLRCAWEPRGADWTASLVEGLCRDLDLIHCVDPFVTPSVHGTPRYYRLHGGADYSYKFSDADLEKLRGWVAGQETFCMFNNVHMWDDALRFRKLLAASTA